MSIRMRIALAAGTIAVALGGAAPALGTTQHWSKAQCKAYVKQQEKAMGKSMGSAMNKEMSNANKQLKEHGCKEKVAMSMS